MVKEHVQWFGAVAKGAVEVSCGTSTPPPTGGGDVELCRGVFADNTGQRPPSPFEGRAEFLILVSSSLPGLTTP